MMHAPGGAGGAAHRNLICHPVTVGILVLERAQHLSQSVIGGGRIQTEGFQPRRINPCLAHVHVGALGHVGELVDVAIGQTQCLL